MKKLLVPCLLLALACPAVASVTPSSPGKTVERSAAAPLNVNQASSKELQKLPGVGKVTDEKIVAYREANGPFATVDDLLKVNGMGKKGLAKIRDMIVTE